MARSTRLAGIAAAALGAALAFGLGSDAAFGAGAKLYKSGPIQVTADGAWVWVANSDNDSVSRIDTATDAVTEYRLPDPTLRHLPRGLSVTEDGSQVWIACHDTDRLYVLRVSDGTFISRIDLPAGSGPYSVALSPDEAHALVTLHRAAALAVIDVPSRSVARLLEPVYWSPLGIAWMEDGVSAWVTHLFADGEDPFLTRVDFSSPRDPKVTSRIIVKSTNPKQSSRLAAADRLAEGGYLTFRGHLAQRPGSTELWLPTQYNNINEDTYTPDTTIQTTIRHLDLTTKLIPNITTTASSTKVILTAVHVHDPQSSSGTRYVGPGWDLGISGPVDLGFSSDGLTAYILNEQSDDLVIMRSATPGYDDGSPAPIEVSVGARPLGLAVSPAREIAWVSNSLDRDVSVIDLLARTELRRIPVTPITGEPFPPAILKGAKLFHTSDDPRISINAKVACASCHPHGEHDGRVWDFENVPGNHGPRSSMSLLGLNRTYAFSHFMTPGGSFWGQLHRSGDRDEVQDFDHTFRGVSMAGTGFIRAGICPEPAASSPVDPTCRNAGKDTDLDAIAAYVLSLEPIDRSPYRDPAGGLSEAAQRGATFFVGPSRATQPADAQCASCHVPETGFVDFTFHDVGQRRPTSENELNLRSPMWSVNTPTLVGVWTTPPYDGVTTYATSIVDVLKDTIGRTSHGRTDGLTGRQLADLAEFVESIDGRMTAAEVRAARDTTPPRVVRVEAASLTRIDAWFDETIDAATAANPANWELTDFSLGTRVPITAAVRDMKNGDRVTFTTSIPAAGSYQLRATGRILDEADTATGGVANVLDILDAANTRRFDIGCSLTVTFGRSGYENFTIGVHDTGMVGPNLATWGHDAPWLFPINNASECVTNPCSNVGFVRFDWSSSFRTTSGIASSADILAASFSLEPEWGDSQDVEIRRALQSWLDPVAGGDFNSSPTGAPTWRDHAHPSATWNVRGAQALGGTGGVPGDYGAGFDLAASVDAVLSMRAINERASFGGAAVTSAFRFWYDNPSLDYGYALRLPAPALANQETKFERSEAGRNELGPVLTLTYMLPLAVAAVPPEVSALGRPPLYVTKEPAGAVRLTFEDLGALASSYNIYEGSIGGFYDHVGALCNALAGAAAVTGRREWIHTPAAGDRYIQVTASSACSEGPAAAGYPPALNVCPP